MSTAFIPFERLTSEMCCPTNRTKEPGSNSALYTLNAAESQKVVASINKRDKSLLTQHRRQIIPCETDEALHESGIQK